MQPKKLKRLNALEAQPWAPIFASANRKLDALESIAAMRLAEAELGLQRAIRESDALLERWAREEHDNRKTS